MSLSDFLTLFSARTHDGFFWSSRPCWMLAVGACISMGISTLIACMWPAEAGEFWCAAAAARGVGLGPGRVRERAALCRGPTRLRVGA